MGWLSRRTKLPELVRGLHDGPSTSVAAWARTTAGVVAFLLALQFVTGALLAFYYVPSAESAHATVAYVEKAAAAGSWLRALHHHGSQWLPLALLLHLAQLFRRGAHERRPVGWLSAVVLLALVMAGGATGYSLPWDARAFYSTRIAAGLAGGLPLVGPAARRWLLGGTEISPLTLSRLYALHVLVVPLLMLATAAARTFIFTDAPVASRGHTEPAGGDAGARPNQFLAQLTRNAVVIALVFLALAFLSLRSPAPLGPTPEAAPAGYLPRPGAQFLWLFQLLKYFSPSAASLVALLLPGLLLGGLALLPFLGGPRARPSIARHRRLAGTALLSLCFALVAGLSALAYLDDARDPRVRAQLARQTQQETEFRRSPFEPRRIESPSGDSNGRRTPQAAAEQDAGNTAAPVGGAAAAAAAPPPEAYVKNCAKCHGAAGEGRSIYPPLVGVASRPDRTVEDLVKIMHDPRAYNLEKRMPSFARKLSEDEKRAVAEWVAALGR